MNVCCYFRNDTINKLVKMIRSWWDVTDVFNIKKKLTIDYLNSQFNDSH